MNKIIFSIMLAFFSSSAFAQLEDILGLIVQTAFEAASSVTQKENVEKNVQPGDAVTPKVSPTELRQMQSRVFATTNIAKVSDVIQDAFMDLNWEGSMQDLTKGMFYKQTMNCETNTVGNMFSSATYSVPCNDSANVFLRLNKEKKNVLVRIALKHTVHGTRNKNSDDAVTNPEDYQKLYSVISKSLFLDAQQLDSKELQ